MANRNITYFLWFFFGWTGLHHVYLGRLNQAIVWFITLGGGCGVGWVRDFWKIPDYLESCNDEKSVQTRYLDRTSVNPRSGCGLLRFVGMIIMGRIVSIVLGALVPDFDEMSNDPLSYYCCKCAYLALLIFGNAIGVYTVANIGDLQCKVRYTLVASFIITPCMLGSIGYSSPSCLLIVLVVWYNGFQWKHVPLQFEKRRAPKRKKILCKNMTCYVLACSVWLVLFAAAVYLNASYTNEEGDTIPLRRVLQKFFRSEAWRQTKDSFYHLLDVWWKNGSTQAWTDFILMLDFIGQVDAYRVIGLSQNASKEEIVKRCRKLSAENHPDRVKTESEKNTAQERFFEIQDACSTLSLLSTRRARNMETPIND